MARRRLSHARLSDKTANGKKPKQTLFFALICTTFVMQYRAAKQRRTINKKRELW